MSKTKLLLSITATSLLLFGCGGSSEVTKENQFKENGYEDYNGNFRKDNKNNANDYTMFSFNGDQSSYSFDSVKDGETVSYFYNSDYGWIGTCKFDFKTDKAKEGSSCSDQEITKVKDVKVSFDNEMKELNLTIEDLNK